MGLAGASVGMSVLRPSNILLQEDKLLQTRPMVPNILNPRDYFFEAADHHFICNTINLVFIQQMALSGALVTGIYGHAYNSLIPILDIFHQLT